MKSRLTKTERRCAEFAAEGLTNAEIAKELGVKPRTINNLMSVVLDKKQVRNRLQLAILAVRGEL